MKEEDCIAFAKCVRNPDSPLNVDAQTVHGESSTCAYHQNEELSSKVKDSQQTKETSSQQVHYNNYDDIFAQIGFVPSVLEIPDEVHRIIIEAAESRGCPNMVEKQKKLDSLCDYCTHSIECKSCVFGTLTQAHK
ncbi:hypothetical protein CE91St9_34330 [Bacteroides thetaiotaomicron]|uniref:hypothetical protein n=1 Tax=Bacteroides thetaiotaomicron TaxID=818 RepID=UPI001FBABBBE|nr:hypothetical protein [Bacteroides thetaiotaomicron]GKH21825.1 hypothetical protein CE91St8_35600 [Bacteroides thetaiotaomicron]GKH68760.1 hypothetical protein CE91St9_34330 [Bacteroides thetaiotaomicron]